MAGIRTGVCIYIELQMCIHVYICIYLYLHICPCMSMHFKVYASYYTYMYIYVNTHIYIYILMYLLIYLYMYMYIYMYMYVCMDWHGCCQVKPLKTIHQKVRTALINSIGGSTARSSGVFFSHEPHVECAKFGVKAQGPELLPSASSTVFGCPRETGSPGGPLAASRSNTCLENGTSAIATRVAVASQCPPYMWLLRVVSMSSRPSLNTTHILLGSRIRGKGYQKEAKCMETVLLLQEHVDLAATSLNWPLKAQKLPSRILHRGSRYLTIKELGLKDHIHCGFWYQNP